MSDFLTVNDARGAHAPSWYAATASPAPERPPLMGERRVDVVVIGAGFAGLSAAYHLAERGLEVACVDAHRVGWGASGRNGGQLAAQPRREIAFYERAVGPDDAKKIYALALEANGLVRALVDRHAIACDLRDGVFESFHRPRSASEVAAEVDRLQTIYGHSALTVLDRDAARAIVRSNDVHGGVLDRRAGHLHPLNFAIGLAAAAEGAGAVLFERTRATAIEHRGAGDRQGVRVTTENGAIEADWLILAVNGYHDGLEPQTAARVMPINNFILATEPLADGGRDVLTEPIAVADSRFVVNYYRLTPDGRMLFGGGESSRARFPARLGPYVRARMLRLFPQLADAEVAYAWGGTLGITVHRAPAMLRFGPRALSISGWSGSGVHMATMAGKIAAETVAGAPDRFDLLARAPTPPFPGGSVLRAPTLALAMFWFGLRDRL